MPSGFEAYDANANIIFRTTSTVVKLLNFYVIPTNADSGYITDPQLTAYPGHVGFVVRTDGYGPLPDRDAQVWISGDRLYWSWPKPAQKTTMKVAYGIK